MTNGVTTYSYGFPSNWLSVRFDTQGGRLFGFELFGANISWDKCQYFNSFIGLTCYLFGCDRICKRCFGSITFLLNFQIGEKNVVVKKEGFLCSFPLSSRGIKSRREHCIQCQRCMRAKNGILYLGQSKL